MRFLFLFLLFIVLFFACNRDATGVDDSQSLTTTAAASAGSAVIPGQKNQKPTEAKPDMTPATQVGRDQMVPANDFSNANGTTDPVDRRRMGVELPSARQTDGSPSGNGQVQAAPTQFELKADAAPISIKEIEASEVFTVSKTPCYGDCKQYSLTVYSNGLVTLNAKKNLERKGLFATVPMGAERTNLLAQFRLATGAGLLTVYPAGESVAADIPATVLRFPGADGKAQNVRVYSDAPTALEELFTKVEMLVKTGDWQKANE